MPRSSRTEALPGPLKLPAPSPVRAARAEIDLEIPASPEDASAADALRLHWKDLPREPLYAVEVCNCSLTTISIANATVINAGCPRHGIKSAMTLRSPGSMVTYGLGR